MKITLKNQQFLRNNTKYNEIIYLFQKIEYIQYKSNLNNKKEKNMSKNTKLGTLFVTLSMI